MDVDRDVEVNNENYYDRKNVEWTRNESSFPRIFNATATSPALISNQFIIKCLSHRHNFSSLSLPRARAIALYFISRPAQTFVLVLKVNHVSRYARRRVPRNSLPVQCVPLRENS